MTRDNTDSSPGGASEAGFNKPLALVFLVCCLVLGVVGLILPLLPGLVFLALAAVVAARFHPPLERFFLRHPRAAGPYTTARCFLDSAPRVQARLLGWGMLKGLLVSAEWLWRGAVWLRAWLGRQRW
ncbi:MAG TPA: DUF454 family protein [Hyphomicrobiales bacterium]|nr:DUF454 family protein [Hyphomicrobiales bacterium]